MKKCTIGTRLVELRERKNVTQKEVAEYLGISSPAVVAYEHDRSRPVRYLNELADFFGVTVDYILCKTDDPRGAHITGEESELLFMYRKLNDEGRKNLLLIAESFGYNPLYVDKEKEESAS